MAASEAGQRDVVEKLLAHGASADAQNAEGCTALYFAAKSGCSPTVLVLHKAGASVRHTTASGNTALHAACAEGRVQAAVLLLQLGALVDPKNKRGETPLMMAAQAGSQELVEYLIASGASAKTSARDGKTALHWAAAAGAAGAARALLEHGADPAARDSNGRFAVELCSDEHSECKALLRESLQARSRAAETAAQELIRAEDKERGKDRKTRRRPPTSVDKLADEQVEAPEVQEAEEQRPKQHQQQHKATTKKADKPAAEATPTSEEPQNQRSWTVVGATTREKKRRSRQTARAQQEAEPVPTSIKPPQQQQPPEAPQTPVVALDADSGKVVPGKSYADAVRAGLASNEEVTKAAPEDLEEQDEKETDEEAEEKRTEQQQQQPQEAEGASQLEVLEARIKWLEMDAARAKARRSRMVRLERKMRAWQELLDASPAVSTLGVTVEHVMESMFGAGGLQALSASQIGALEELHFAALRHLSDAKVEIAKKQLLATMHKSSK